MPASAHIADQEGDAGVLGGRGTKGVRFHGRMKIAAGDAAGERGAVWGPDAGILRRCRDLALDSAIGPTGEQ
jgi:hypothetical protein